MARTFVYRVSSVLLLLLAGPILGCHADQHEPKLHRPVREVCSHSRPAAAGAFDAGPAPDGGPSQFGCASDSECTMGANGRCTPSATGGLRCADTHLPRDCDECTFDHCFADTDCTSGGVCACREDPVNLDLYGAGNNTPNVCIVGNCQIDADCGSGGYCSPSRGAGCTNYGYVGYFCHTSDDECSDDTDCHGARCVWDTSRTRWFCSAAACADG